MVRAYFSRFLRGIKSILENQSHMYRKVPHLFGTDQRSENPYQGHSSGSPSYLVAFTFKIPKNNSFVVGILEVTDKEQDPDPDPYQTSQIWNTAEYCRRSQVPNFSLYRITEKS
jgi:hypothetical protein